MKKYGNKYGFKSEDKYRRGVFVSNYKKMQAHNKKKDSTYKMKVTKFTGLTNQEFEQYALGQFKETGDFNSLGISLP